MNENICSALNYFLEEKRKNTSQEEINKKLKTSFGFNLDEINSSVEYMNGLGYTFGKLEKEIKITLIGIDFICNGGFVSQRESIISDKQNAQKNEKKLRYYTLLLAVGTIGLVFWDILKYYLEHHCFCH